MWVFTKLTLEAKGLKSMINPFKLQYLQKKGGGGVGAYKRKFTVTHVHDGESTIPPQAASL